MLPDCRGATIVYEFSKASCMPCAAMKDMGILDGADERTSVPITTIMLSEATEDIFRKYDVEVVPTIAITRNCYIISRKTGFTDEDGLVEYIHKYTNPESVEDVRRIMRAYASQHDFTILNERVFEQLLKNKRKYGHLYCPCKTREPANICPCNDHREEIAEQGHCTCGLFGEGDAGK